jgi:hypothetical protein
VSIGPNPEYVIPDSRHRWEANAQPSSDHTAPLLPKPLLKRFAKQIAMGVLCSCIATVIFKFADMKRGILYFCSAVVHVGGDPLTGEKGAIKKAEDKLNAMEDKIGSKLGGVKNMPFHAPTLHKTPEQLEAEAKIKEEKEKRQYESARKVVIAKLEALNVLFDSEASLEKLHVELKEAEEMQRKRPLLDHADKIGLQVDPKEPYDVLAKRIKEAELDADYQEQVRQYEKNLEARQKIIDSYNARCPNPPCHRAFKTTAKTGTFRCPKCRIAFSPAQARANWTLPPMPPAPKRKTGVMDRIKSLFGR